MYEIVENSQRNKSGEKIGGLTSDSRVANNDLWGNMLTAVHQSVHVTGQIVQSANLETEGREDMINLQEPYADWRMKKMA